MAKRKTNDKAIMRIVNYWMPTRNWHPEDRQRLYNMIKHYALKNANAAVMAAFRTLQKEGDISSTG